MRDSGALTFMRTRIVTDAGTAIDAGMHIGIETIPSRHRFRKPEGFQICGSSNTTIEVWNGKLVE